MIAQPQTHVNGEVASQDSSATICKLASTFEERMSAYKLVYENYLKTGLIEANEYGARVTPYQLLPSTSTFIAQKDGVTIATVSLVGDGELGLPMEAIYGDEVDEHRQRGLSFGEISCLAVHDVPFKEFLPIFVKLMRLMFQQARHYGMDQLFIAVHPRHARFYQRTCGFTQFGEQKSYPSVRNNPAVANSVDFARMEEQRPPCYDHFFAEAIDPADLHPQAISPTERALLQHIAELADAPCESVMA